MKYLVEKIFDNRLIRIYYNEFIPDYVIRMHNSTSPASEYFSIWLKNINNLKEWRNSYIPDKYKSEILKIVNLLIFN